MTDEVGGDKILEAIPQLLPAIVEGTDLLKEIPKEIPKEKVPAKPVTRCQHIILTQKRRKHPCSQKPLPGESYCGSHIQKHGGRTSKAKAEEKTSLTTDELQNFHKLKGNPNANRKLAKKTMNNNSRKVGDANLLASVVGTEGLVKKIQDLAVEPEGKLEMTLENLTPE